MTVCLAGDIGGTKTLLSLYGTPVGAPLLEARFPSSDWPDLAPMVREFLARAAALGLDAPRVACLAVAGPVQAGQARLTNLPWHLEEDHLARSCGLERLELVNDFAVLVHGLPHLRADQLALVREGVAAEGEPLLVVGAGTGLGVAIGVPTAAGGLALATEGGHGTFAPRTEAEWRLAQWLQADLGVERLSVERVVSGTGLGAVARWLLAERHPRGDHPLMAAALAAGTLDLPAAVAAAAAAGEPLARDALDLWLGAYGSATGDLALTALARGGIWLAGGTAASQLEALRSRAFLGPLLAKGRLRAVLEPIPIQAIIDPAVGVFSAACRAACLVDRMGH